MAKKRASAARFMSSLFLAKASSSTPKATIVPTVGTWFKSRWRCTSSVVVMNESLTADVGDKTAGGDDADPDEQRERGQPLHAARDDAVSPLAVNERANRQREHHAHRDERELGVIQRDVTGGRRVRREENAARHEGEEEAAPENLEKGAQR